MVMTSFKSFYYIFFTLIATLLSYCSFEQLGAGLINPIPNDGIPGCNNPLSANYDPEATINDGSCEPTDCSLCDHFISATDFGFDADAEGVQPGDIICLQGGIVYDRPIEIRNLRGTAGAPILITNCGGLAEVDMSGRTYVMKTVDSQHFRITGTGWSEEQYGIRLINANNIGLQMDYLSSNFEIDHIEVTGVGFAGIMAKTDPSCDDATIRGNFVMRDISIHDNYVHDTGGEGLYVGNSFYANGVNLSCGIRLPHDIVNVDIYRNRVENTGWEAIQLGTAISGARVFNNRVLNFGTANRNAQNNGIQIGEGTGGLCYNNLVINGPGTGIIVLGYGDNIVFNNIIVNPGKNGIFCDTRFSPGSGFKFINNTIIDPGTDGININASELELNTLVNNLIVNPGNYDLYENDPTSKTGLDSYINAANPNVLIDGNYFTRDISQVGFENVGSNNFDLLDSSPAIDIGIDVLSFGVTFDFFNNNRPAGTNFDAGAIEKQD